MVAFYLITSGFAVSLGMLLALAVSPGAGLDMPEGLEVPEPPE